MRELEFRNTIDQYDLAIVVFFKKDDDDCKRMLSGFKYSAYKSRGRADFIAIGAKSAPDLCDELGVDKVPTIFSFRNGYLVEKIVNHTAPKDLFYYVKNITTYKYKYVHDASEARPLFTQSNNTLIVALPTIDARMDKVLAVVSAKHFSNMQILVPTTPELAHAFGVNSFPSITLCRTHDDNNVTFSNDPARVTVKSLSDFVEKNIAPKYELMVKFEDEGSDIFFAAIFDLTSPAQTLSVREILEKVSSDHQGEFKIRYGDALLLRSNLTDINLQNWTVPLFLFLQKQDFGYRKWVFSGKATPLAVSAFWADFKRGRQSETVVDAPLESKPKGNYVWMTGSELKAGLDAKDKDYVVNFVGHPCANCQAVDQLFAEAADWAKEHGVKSVLFGRVDATCNDVPVTVWKNETFPYGWFFPASNRSAAFPIGKRRQLYWMVHLLKDNMTKPFTAELPPKPEKTPYVKREDL
jgi:thiol-disulfide isomerase/thioredoxin